MSLLARLGHILPKGILEVYKVKDDVETLCTSIEYNRFGEADHDYTPYVLENHRNGFKTRFKWVSHTELVREATDYLLNLNCPKDKNEKVKI